MLTFSKQYSTLLSQAGTNSQQHYVC